MTPPRPAAASPATSQGQSFRAGLMESSPPNPRSLPGHLDVQLLVLRQFVHLVGLNRRTRGAEFAVLFLLRGKRHHKLGLVLTGRHLDGVVPGLLVELR